jgi:hypothetical protein
MSVISWSNIPDSIGENLSAYAPTQAPGQVNNKVIDGPIFSVQGQAVTSSTTTRVNGADIAPSHGGLIGTIRNNGGFHTSRVTPECTVDLPGLGRTSVKVAENMGYLTRNGDGLYSEGPNMGKGVKPSLDAPQDGPNEAKQDTPQGEGPSLFSDNVEKSYGALIQDIPQGTYDSMLGSATAFLSEGSDLDGIASSLAPRLASAMGIEPGKAANMVKAGAEVWQAQADSTVIRMGADHEEFYQWAQANRSSELQQAVQGHLLQRSTQGYRDMVNDYFDNTVPTDDALRKGGFPVKTDGQERMVKIKGHWMSVGSAVKARLV